MTSQVKHTRKSHLRWIKLGDMRVSPKAQREFRRPHAVALAAAFELEAMGFPVVSWRDGYWWVLDGQHRIQALRYVGFSDDDQIQCECYESLTEAEEAELFLRRDERRKVSTFDRFRIGVVAEREEDLDIQRIVALQNCKISRDKEEHCIGAIAALRFAYQLSPVTMRRAVAILDKAYDGDPSAFQSDLIRGMALVCQRYDGSLNDDQAIAKLGRLNGGTISLIRKANALKEKTGHTKANCVAAAVVDTLNARGASGRKLESWWR